jgi:hypothetical protein
MALSLVLGLLSDLLFEPMKLLATEIKQYIGVFS